MKRGVDSTVESFHRKSNKTFHNEWSTLVNFTEIVPEPILYEIFSFLVHSDLCGWFRTRAVCRKWKLLMYSFEKAFIDFKLYNDISFTASESSNGNIKRLWEKMDKSKVFMDLQIPFNVNNIKIHETLLFEAYNVIWKLQNESPYYIHGSFGILDRKFEFITNLKMILESFGWSLSDLNDELTNHRPYEVLFKTIVCHDEDWEYTNHHYFIDKDNNRCVLFTWSNPQHMNSNSLDGFDHWLLWIRLGYFLKSRNVKCTLEVADFTSSGNDRAKMKNSNTLKDIYQKEGFFIEYGHKYWTVLRIPKCNIHETIQTIKKCFQFCENYPDPRMKSVKWFENEREGVLTEFTPTPSNWEKVIRKKCLQPDDDDFFYNSHMWEMYCHVTGDKRSYADIQNKELLKKSAINL